METNQEIELLKQKVERIQDAIINLDKAVQYLLVELKTREIRR